MQQTPSNNLPDQLPEAFSSVFGLGTPVAFFPAGKGARWGGLSAAIIFLLGSFVVVGVGLFTTFSDVQQYGPAMLSKDIGAPLIFGGVLFLIALFAGWYAYTNWNRAVAVYSNGFAYNDNKGLQTWHWEEVDQFLAAITRHYTNGIYTGTTYTYTLRKADGGKVVFDNRIKKVQDLGPMIERATTPNLHKRAVDAYNVGQTVLFGPVALNKGGITFGKKSYPWSEVAQVSINKGILQVSKKGGGMFSGASAAASTIPNLAVLLSIVDQVVGVKAGR
jgi:uncharacterized protein DUF6585